MRAVYELNKALPAPPAPDDDQEDVSGCVRDSDHLGLYDCAHVYLSGNEYGVGYLLSALTASPRVACTLRAQRTPSFAL